MYAKTVITPLNFAKQTGYPPTGTEGSLQGKYDHAISLVPPQKSTADTPLGKHIAQRKTGQWPDYGDPKTWNEKFETAVKNSKELILNGHLETTEIINHFETIRHNIAVERGNKCHIQFGLRRDHFIIGTGLYLTPLGHKNIAYGYALERAIKIPYDGKYFVKHQAENGKQWARKLYYPYYQFDCMRYGLVQGFIAGCPVPLTQYIFCPRIQEHRNIPSLLQYFGYSDDNYIGKNKESAIWLHPAPQQIPVVLKHIETLIAKAIGGDLTVIPSIHWWYVHLAPTWRGSGGTAEMLTKTLCRLHGVDLPPWNDGIAPSVEILLEPNEERFCANYHRLFARDQDDLKKSFTPISQTAPEPKPGQEGTNGQLQGSPPP